MPEPSPPARPGLPVGRFLGVPVVFAPSWLLLAGFVTLAYAPFVGDSLPGIGGARYAVSFVFAVMLAGSVLVHEMAHVAVGVALRLRVRRVTLFALGGVSEMTDEPPDAGSEYLVAMAGPLASLLLGAVALAASDLTPAGSTIQLLVDGLAATNLLVAAANLLPGLPLDGGRVLRAGIWAVLGDRLRGTIVSAWFGRVVALLLVVAAAALAGTESGTVVDALIIVLVAAFLWLGAGVALRSARLGVRVPQLSVAELVRPAIGVTARTPVSEAVRQAGAQAARSVVVVDSAGRPDGIVDEAAVRRLPAERRPWVEVGELSRAIGADEIVQVDLSGQPLLDRLGAHPAPAYLVVDADWRIRGVLATEDLQRALTTPAVRTAPTAMTAPAGPAPRAP